MTQSNFLFSLSVGYYLLVVRLSREALLSLEHFILIRGEVLARQFSMAHLFEQF